MRKGQKIICVDDTKQKVLKKGNVYTVEQTVGDFEDRVYIKEWKRFSFSKDRFEIVE